MPPQKAKMPKSKNIVVDLVKMNGAGNSFVIIEKMSDKNISRSKLAQIICGSDLNGTTDGLLFIEKLQPQVFKWDFFNSDGSTAEMCGNAARCATRYLSEKEKILNTEILIHTRAGPVCGIMTSEEEIKIEMPEIKIEELQDGFQKINTGVPHLIFPIEKIDFAAQNKTQARELREKWNTNVTFVAPQSKYLINAVTYERGVEDFTRACGTGAVAAGAWRMIKEEIGNTCQVQMPGGMLTIQWDKKSRPILIGSAMVELTKQIIIEVEDESI